jgi:hypothetical protein
MSGFFKDSHELKESKCPTNFQGLEFAVQLAKDGGVVSADIEHLVEL